MSDFHGWPAILMIYWQQTPIHTLRNVLSFLTPIAVSFSLTSRNLSYSASFLTPQSLWCVYRLIFESNSAASSTILSISLLSVLSVVSFFV